MDLSHLQSPPNSFITTRTQALQHGGPTRTFRTSIAQMTAVYDYISRASQQSADCEAAVAEISRAFSDAPLVWLPMPEEADACIAALAASDAAMRVRGGAGRRAGSAPAPHVLDGRFYRTRYGQESV